MIGRTTARLKGQRQPLSPRAAIPAEGQARRLAESPAHRLFDPSDSAARFRSRESAVAREMYRPFAHISTGLASR
jgi:hypothetical protein